MKRIAVILFNLGGPDCPEAVRPFLFNLFNDRAIITVANPMRWCLAKFISTRRHKEAQEIYRHLGGKSPILEETQAQAEALQASLEHGSMGDRYKVLVSMRYWKPFSHETMQELQAYHPDEVVLLPLYPQYSTTTTQSSLDDWQCQVKQAGLEQLPCKTIKHFYKEPTYIQAHCTMLREVLQELLPQGKSPRILFSAHGLPKKIIDAGDPYQQQVEANVQEIVNNIGYNNLDIQVCYQSKVGPLEWIGPSTESEIIRAAQDKVPVVIVPIAFVSEHSETLVELDIEYKALAQEHGLHDYYRVPALGCNPLFIQSLTELCLKAA